MLEILESAAGDRSQDRGCWSGWSGAKWGANSPIANLKVTFNAL